MEITFTPNGLSPIQLTGDNASEGAFDLDGSAQSALQIIQPIGAEVIDLLDQENDAITLRFSVTREHASAGAAFFYWLEHMRLVRGVGTLRMRITEQNESLFAVRYLVPAAIQARGGKPYASTTEFQYQVVGGAIQTTEN